LIDGDPQGSLTISLGYREPDRLDHTLASLLSEVMEEQKPSVSETIIHHEEGVDLIPANIELSSKKDAKKQAAYDMLTFVLEEE
jgi:chromosome partitioning protein